VVRASLGNRKSLFPGKESSGRWKFERGGKILCEIEERGRKGQLHEHSHEGF